MSKQSFFANVPAVESGEVTDLTVDTAIAKLDVAINLHSRIVALEAAIESNGAEPDELTGSLIEFSIESFDDVAHALEADKVDTKEGKLRGAASAVGGAIKKAFEAIVKWFTNANPLAAFGKVKDGGKAVIAYVNTATELTQDGFKNIWNAAVNFKSDAKWQSIKDLAKEVGMLPALASLDALFVGTVTAISVAKLVKAVYSFFQFAKKAEAEIKAIRAKVGAGEKISPKEQKAMTKALKKGKLIKEVTGTPMFKVYSTISKKVTV